MDIFFEIHRDLPREGPGDDKSTRQALSFIRNLPPKPMILDIGCGPGQQTLVLAQNTTGKIIAIDTHQPFLDHLQRQAQSSGFSNRIAIANETMFSLPFPQPYFDLIWSEGAIYIIGVEQGLRSWRNLLNPGGYIAMTELSWLKPDPPDEVLTYWQNNYPGMVNIAQNLNIIKTTGFHEINHFVLPKSSWWDNYYSPIEARLLSLRGKYCNNPQALMEINATQKELDMHRKYSDWYGYVFYIIQLNT